MVAPVNPYAQGYEAAYQDMYAALRDDDHVKHCGICRQCGVVKEVTETLLEKLADKMTVDEFMSMATALARPSPRDDETVGYFVIRWTSGQDDLPPLFRD